MKPDTWSSIIEGMLSVQVLERYSISGAGMLSNHPIISSDFNSYLFARIPPGIMVTAIDTNPIAKTRPISVKVAFRERRNRDQT